MSDDRVAVVRGLFEEWNERRGELTLEYFDPDVELDTRGLPQPDFQGVYRGFDEYVQWARTWISAWEDAQQFPVWIQERGDRVVAWVRMRLVGRHSGIDASVFGGEPHGGWSFTFRDCKIVAIRLIVDEDEARAALDGT